ncbi:MAG TPA: hypothetical protein PKO06_04235, partial [Candidatus Ozemobacteraceae bacterium]|nr:hypothetical protein [Candidatus Ozemobacteraceae bacterium]
RQQLFRQVGTVVDLATDDVARSLAGVRDSMRLLARMPAFRQATQAGQATPALRMMQSQAGLLLVPCVQTEEALRMTRRQFHEDLVLSVETLAAEGRRLFYSVGLWPAVEAEPVMSLGDGAGDSVSSLAMNTGGTDVRGNESSLVEQLIPVIEAAFNALVPVTSLVDRVFPVGLPTLADPRAAENILRASLSDRDLIRSVAVKQLDGQEIISVTEIASSFQMLSNWVKTATRAARSFYAGPVWFEEGLGRPIWNVAVPLRDEEREPFAMLSSQVDLGFLGDMAQKTRLTATSYLLVVDDDGVVIAHPKASLVANQVNLTHSNRAVAEALRGEEGVQELRLGDTTFIVGYRSLKKVDAAMLPAWGILYLTPLSEAIGSLIWDAANALVLIAVALYLIFWCAGILIEVIEEGEV